MKFDLSTKTDHVIATSEGSRLDAQVTFIANPNSGLVERAALDCTARVKFKVDVPNHPIWQLVVDAINLIYGGRINSALCGELDVLVNQDLTLLLQGINASLEPFLHGAEPPPALPKYGRKALNFTGNAFIGLVDFLLDDLIGANGPFGVNLIASALTNGTGAYVYQFPGQGQSLATVNVAALGNVTFGISRLSFRGLNTFSAVRMAVPRDSYSLDSFLSLADFELNISFFVNTSVGTSGIVEENHNGQSLFERGELRFRAGNLSMGLDLAAALDAHLLESLSFDQLVSPGCLKASVMGGNLTQARLQFNLHELLLVALANGGENQLEVSLDRMIDNLLLMFVTSYDSVIPAFVNSIVLTPAILAANQAIYESLFAQQTPCALSRMDGASSSYPLNSTASLVVPVCAAVLWIGISAIMLILHCVKYSKEEREFEDDESGLDISGSKAEKSSLLSLQGDSAYELSSFGAAGKSSHLSTPIGLDPRVWWITKLAIPFLVVGNIGLFIVSNVSVGASVFVYIHLGNETVSSPSLFSFTLANSVHDMWVAGVYPLSLVIAIFSGAWPYAKLLSMLAVWLVPMKSKLREKVLTFLDMLGKWSLIDAFVLVFMMVAFRFNIVIPGSALAHTQSGDAHIDCLVEAGLGFYIFLLATMFSLVLTHVILAVHRWIEEKNEEIAAERKGEYFLPDIPLRAERGNEEKLAIFQLKHRLGDGSVVTASPFGTIVVAVLLVVSFGLVMGGAAVHSFVFHFRGAAGAIFPYAGVEKDRPYSLISLALELPEAALSPNGFGVRWVQATLLIFSLVVPLSYLFMLFVLWMIPMKPLLQGRLFILTEVLRAWSAMEVFVLAVIAALTELEQFAQFLVGDRCDSINPLLAIIFGEVLNGDAKCFDVTTSLADGCWLMFSACVLYIFTGQVVMTLVHEAIYPKLSEKEERSKLVRFLLWLRLAQE